MRGIGSRELASAVYRVTFESGFFLEDFIKNYDLGHYEVPMRFDSGRLMSVKVPESLHLRLSQIAKELKLSQAQLVLGILGNALL